MWTAAQMERQNPFLNSARSGSVENRVCSVFYLVLHCLLRMLNSSVTGWDAAKFRKRLDWIEMREKNTSLGPPLVKNVWSELPESNFNRTWDELMECYQIEDISHGSSIWVYKP